MKIRYIGPSKSILVLVAGIVIFWTVAANAYEQWEAKASARVNLRRTPSLSGEILSIIPNGHKVRIMEKKGLWCKVDVEGEIKGKGWVHAKYLERILPKALKTESSTQIVRVEIASGEQKQGIHPVEPPSKSRTEVEKVKPLRTPLPGKTPTTGVKGQFSSRNELQGAENESIALSQLEIPLAVNPVHMPPAQPPYSGIMQDAPETNGKDSSGLIEQGDSTDYQNNIPGEKKKHGGVAPEIVPTVSGQLVSDSHAMASSARRSAVSHKTKGLIFKRRSIGPVEIALKLLSIVLYCLVVLLLYKGNEGTDLEW
jgi:uncharacterized protein YraI